jgi:hypothetical protein
VSERIDSDFAILDVKRGRVALAKRINSGDNRIPVTIRGYITAQNGNDDGTSIEFTVEVTDAYERLR